jgi:hypothetical protein
MFFEENEDFLFLSYFATTISNDSSKYGRNLSPLSLTSILKLYYLLKSHRNIIKLLIPIVLFFNIHIFNTQI